jgi:hypothetical protein
MAKRYRANPVAKQDKAIAVAGADPSDLEVIETLKRLLNTDIEIAGRDPRGHRHGA